MAFLRNNWFRLVFVAFAVLAFYGLLFAQGMSMLQRLLLASLMALALHQFEEYQLPGGGPVVINRYFYGEKDNYRRFPGNWQSTMVVNLSAYVFYVLALALPNLMWLGIATMFFNLYQVLGHCVQMNVKMPPGTTRYGNIAVLVSASFVLVPQPGCCNRAGSCFRLDCSRRGICGHRRSHHCVAGAGYEKPR